jgi:hypothetical protein
VKSLLPGPGLLGGVKSLAGEALLSGRAESFLPGAGLLGGVGAPLTGRV